MQISRREEAGIALVITLLVMTILLVMGTAFLSISSTETLIAINERNRVQALHLAEAGVERSIAELNVSSAYGGTTGPQSLGFGTYETTVTNGGPVPGVLDPKQIVSNGYVPNNLVPNRAMAQVEVDVQRGSPFQQALFGTSKIELDGTEVDSYDSSQGPYNPATATAKGHIHSNDSVILWSDNIVNGNAQAVNNITDNGPGTNVITGSSTSGVPSISVVTNITYPPPTADTTGISPPGAYNTVSKNLVVDPGVTVTLDPGTYSFNEVMLGSGAKIAVNGPVEIYMTGQFYAEGGNVINTSNIPANLVIFSSYNGTDGSGTDALFMDAGAAGAGQFYGAIYALNGEAEFQNAAPGWQIYGAIVAKHIDLEGGARFHYDVTLANMRSPAGKFRQTAGTWREVFP